MRTSIGLFGGTFDPVHFGHLRAAAELCDALRLGRLVFLPSGSPWQKGDSLLTPAAHRAAMLRLAIAQEPRFAIDERELARAGATYTFDTLSEFRAELGNGTPLLWLIGNEAFERLHTWHRWRELFLLAHFVVAWRGAVARESADAAPDAAEFSALRKQMTVVDAGVLKIRPAGLIYHLRIPYLDISATSIRDKIRGGQCARYLVPDAVLDYIQQQHLYIQE